MENITTKSPKNHLFATFLADLKGKIIGMNECAKEFFNLNHRQDLGLQQLLKEYIEKEDLSDILVSLQKLINRDYSELFLDKIRLKYQELERKENYWYLSANLTTIGDECIILLNIFTLQQTARTSKTFRLKFYLNFLSHDLSNCLGNTNMALYLCKQLLKNEMNLTDLKELYEIITSQIERGKRIISLVRKLSEGETFLLSLKLQNICDMLKKAILYVKKTYCNKNFSIMVHSRHTDIELKTSEFLYDVFVNILQNAIIHNENQEIKITITIYPISKKEMNFLQIEIEDNGVGIPNIKKEVLFNYSRLKEKFSTGMGIGLTLASDIMRMMNGKIKVENRIKDDYTKGSKFTLLIPHTSEGRLNN
ncbi:MAG: putative Histidine kinase [Promethearchaeota archaeon]|nr:MAG: putative Histidine kinase [Candidatus Lokiarchaeota archaeon]